MRVCYVSAFHPDGAGAPDLMLESRGAMKSTAIGKKIKSDEGINPTLLVPATTSDASSPVLPLGEPRRIETYTLGPDAITFAGDYERVTLRTSTLGLQLPERARPGRDGRRPVCRVR